MNEEQEFKFTLGQCKTLISSYKRFYMRKNSKHRAVIQVRCHCPGIEKRWWKYYLELVVNNEMREQDAICAEAYDALSSDPFLKKEEFKNLEFITLCEFIPGTLNSEL